MSDYQSTAAAVQPVTLHEAKAHLNVSHANDDTLIADLLQAATLAIEERTNRCFVHQTRVLKMRTFTDQRYMHGRRIYPSRSPLSSVSSITYVASSGTTTTLPSSDYIVGTGDRPGYISEAYDATWPDTRVHDDNVTVTYVAGHSSSSTGVPANIKVAINQTVGHWYRNREAVSEGTMSELPLGVELLLQSEAIEHYG